MKTQVEIIGKGLLQLIRASSFGRESELVFELVIIQENGKDDCWCGS